MCRTSWFLNWCVHGAHLAPFAVPGSLLGARHVRSDRSLLVTKISWSFPPSTLLLACHATTTRQFPWCFATAIVGMCVYFMEPLACDAHSVCSTFAEVIRPAHLRGNKPKGTPTPPGGEVEDAKWKECDCCECEGRADASAADAPTTISINIDTSAS